MASDLGPNGSSPSEGPRRGVPYLPAALGVIGLVVLILAGGFLITRHFRTPLGTQAAPSIGISAAPLSSPSGGSLAVVSPAASAAPSISAVASVAPALANEIQAAYMHYWDVRTQAYLSDDTSHLSEVMAGAELARAEKQIQDLKASGRAGKLDVDHHILIVSASSDQAVVYDEYLNRSVFIDLSTNREIAASAPPGTAKISYDMQKLNGIWKVVDGAQHD